MFRLRIIWYNSKYRYRRWLCHFLSDYLKDAQLNALTSDIISKLNLYVFIIILFYLSILTVVYLSCFFHNKLIIVNNFAHRSRYSPKISPNPTSLYDYLNISLIYSVNFNTFFIIHFIYPLFFDLYNYIIPC